MRAFVVRTVGFDNRRPHLRRHHRHHQQQQQQPQQPQPQPQPHARTCAHVATSFFCPQGPGMASRPVRSGWLLKSGAARCLRFGQTRWRSVRFAQRADRVRRAEGRALADLSVLCDRTQPRRDLREVLGLPRVTAGVSGTREHMMRCVAHGVAGANHRAPVLAFVRPPGLCLPQVLRGRARAQHKQTIGGEPPWYSSTPSVLSPLLLAAGTVWPSSRPKGSSGCTRLCTLSHSSRLTLAFGRAV
jgi:hypothetical protein